MKNSKKNEELQSRREFFKKAVKGTLPILGALVLSNIPTVSSAVQGIPYGCEGSSCRTLCTGGCDGACRESCRTDCAVSCQGIAAGKSKTGCFGCEHCCFRYCQTSCDGHCNGSCRGSSYKAR